MAQTEATPSYNCLVLLGPTAVGKTAIGVSLANHYHIPIISADSRQVYKGLDIGSGKDIADYTIEVGDGEKKKITIPYHLIDITTLKKEYNVFDYQNDFYSVFTKLSHTEHLFANQQILANVPAIVVGGTGMYLDAVVRGYDFLPVPENETLRKELEQKSLEELDDMLISLKPDLHNKSDLALRDRVVRAIEIQLFMRSPECEALRKSMTPRPNIVPFILGTTLPRDLLHSNIEKRLKERLDEGMIEEVEGLHADGASWERLEHLGLEYRFVSEFLEGKIKTKEELFTGLYHAISQFAKRQETWFRGMEKKGVVIHWLPSVMDKEVRYNAALSLIEENIRLR